MQPRSYVPIDVLQPFIKELIVHEEQDEQSYKVFPSTNLVMGFQFKGQLSYLENGSEFPLSASGISGLRDSYRLFHNTKNIGTVLVIFKEQGAAAFFKAPLHELFGESLSLDQFMLRSEMEQVEERLAEAPTDAGRIQIVQSFLLGKLHTFCPDKLVDTALHYIHQSKGALRIADLADRLCISQSPLEKRFRKVVGASPKKFASIVRFRNILQGPTHSWNDLIEKGSYFDQAHFIKDFKSFTGETPEQFFKP